MSKKWVLIWQHFIIALEDSKVVSCKAYGERVSRGGSNTKTFNRTNLVYHLRMKHPEEFATYEASASKCKHSAATSSCSAQPTLADFTEKSTIWDINLLKANAVHKKLER